MNDISPSVSTDTTLTVMADTRRRTVLRYLMENGHDTLSVDELVAGIEDDVSLPTETSWDRETHLLVELQQKHLPKLREAGVIDYDDRSRTLRYQSRDDVEALLRFLEETLG